jgi:hypothetical protein
LDLKLSALIAPLIAAKVDHDIIMAQVLAFEAEQSDALERRRQADAERQARKRSRDVTLRHSDRALAGAGDARVEDKTSNLDIEPQEQKDTAPASPSPRQHLESVLDAERAGAVIEHRKRIKSPLTPHAAKLLAKEFAKCADPNAGADRMIKDGWRGFDAKWMDRPPQARAGPNGRASPMDHFQNYASEINGQNRDARGDSSDWDDAPGLPIRAIEHHD